MLRFLTVFLLCFQIAFAAPPSLDRIVVIGASVSRGFTESEPFGGEKSTKLRFDRYIDAALTAPHGKITNDANILFFMDPEKHAPLQLKRLTKRQPTLVISIDFMFWFLYGYPAKTGDRLELFDRGLALLSQIECSLVIGDIPDASAAIGHMLAKAMVPDAAIIKEANRRLTAWAKDRPNTSIVPLEAFMKAAQQNTEIKAGICQWKAGETRALLQPDQLHPNPTGCTALAIATLASLSNQELPDSAVLWDPAALQKQATE